MRKRTFASNSIALAGLFAASQFAACSGGGEFKPPDPDIHRDASVESGAGGGTGGSVPHTGGTSSSGGVILEAGGTANGGVTQPFEASNGAAVDAGHDSGTDAHAPPECDEHDDCRALACDAAPQCVNGVCALGTCAVPDAGNCVADCVRSGEIASCVVRGKDKDGDGHLDARCAENPGDDCDDDRANVHAGAAEVCDGLDNDCNGKQDLFDGLLLGGRAKQLDAIPAPKSARLGLLPRVAGYLLLTAEAEVPYNPGAPSKTRFLDPEGNPLSMSMSDITSDVSVFDPALGATSNGALVFGSNGTAVQVVDVYATAPPGSVATVPTVVKYSNIYGRSATAGANGSIAGVWAEDSTTEDLGGIAGAIFDPLGNPGTARSLAKVASATAHPGRTSIASRGAAGYAVTWVESQLPPSGSTTMDQVIHLTLTDAALQTTSDFKLDVFREYPYLLELVRGEVTRPQVVVDGEALMVGYLRPEDFIAFVRVSEQGAKLCGPTPLKGIRGWGAAHSMAVTPFGVLFAATYKDGSTDLYRVSQPPGAPGQACVVEHLGWLSARDAMIASNARLDVSLGDAAIALGAGGRLGVTWVERAATAAESDPSHLMFRVLGPKLCD